MRGVSLKRRPIDGVQQIIMLFVSSHRISSLQNTLVVVAVVVVMVAAMMMHFFFFFFIPSRPVPLSMD